MFLVDWLWSIYCLGFLCSDFDPIAGPETALFCPIDYWLVFRIVALACCDKLVEEDERKLFLDLERYFSCTFYL